MTSWRSGGLYLARYIVPGCNTSLLGLLRCKLVDTLSFFVASFSRRVDFLLPFSFSSQTVYSSPTQKCSSKKHSRIIATTHKHLSCASYCGVHHVRPVCSPIAQRSVVPLPLSNVSKQKKIKQQKKETYQFSQLGTNEFRVPIVRLLAFAVMNSNKSENKKRRELTSNQLRESGANSTRAKKQFSTQSKWEHMPRQA